jgi:hypothetical protein
MAMHQAAALDDFGGKPLIVLAASREHDGTWQAAQDKLASLSTNSRHRVVADAPTSPLFSTKLMRPQSARPSAMLSRQCGSVARCRARRSSGRRTRPWVLPDLKAPQLVNGSAEFQSSASARCTCHLAEASVASG